MKKNEKSKREKEKTLEQIPFFAHLPLDIINDIQILLRLPVKTLVRCRYVCRLWLYLISNSVFINTHLQKSNLSSNCVDRKLIVSLGFYHPYFESRIKSFALDNESNVVVVDYPNIDPQSRVSGTIIGSCNGLVCVYYFKFGIFIWNPCTRVSKKLPPLSLMYNLTNYGFGYDPFSDDYKVVLMVNSDNSEPKRVVRVYSLKSNSWGKTVDLHCKGCPLQSEGQYINGILYWGMFYSANNHPVIVSLDLGNETFREIEQPCYGRRCRFYKALGVLEGCLSVFCHFNDIPCLKFCIEVWVMKEDGVTWTKLYTIPSTDKHKQPGSSFYIPLCISMIGEILLADGDSLVLYNPKNGSFRNPNFSDWSEHSQSLTYVESLVSPNIYEEASITQH